MKRILYIGACFGSGFSSDNWNYNIFCCGDSYSIKRLKISGIRYSKRMLILNSAVSIHLMKLAALMIKYFTQVVKTILPAFNYVVPEHER